MRRQILSYAIKYQGEYFRIKKAIENNEKYEVIDYCGNYITILDDEYPKKLLDLKYPPFIIFYEGNLNLLNDKMISVVGSRESSEIGIRNTKVLIDNLDYSYCIISGLAKGIDAYAHTFALNYHHTIGVIGCGLNVIYPKCNKLIYEELKNNHLIISEYPNNVQPLKYHFPWRNRIIAALSDKLIVVEAKKRSGTLISVNEAIDINRDVYCFPGNFNDKCYEGCNLLIKEGANILCDIEDIKNL